MKSVLVLGGAGNMGRRYCAVLRHLGIIPVPIDVADDSLGSLDRAVCSVQGIIIATPTKNHSNDIANLAALNIPILCEKPISTHLDRVRSAVAICKHTETPLAMVNQYSQLVSTEDVGDTLYNYWNHGRDGLAWDCISIITLATGKISLRENSALWECMINGRRLSPEGMDLAYIKMVRAWVSNPIQADGYIEMAHNRVHDFARQNEQSTSEGVDRNSGPKHEQPIAKQGDGHHRWDDDDSACPRPSPRKCQLP